MCVCEIKYRSRPFRLNFPMEFSKLNSPPIHIVSSTESPQFNTLKSSLTRSSLVGLDAEWKPVLGHQYTFPTVVLFRIACRVDSDSLVFLLDLLAIPLISIPELFKGMFESPHILKLRFGFEQDLSYLSSTFVSQGCNLRFDKVNSQFTTVYVYLRGSRSSENSFNVRIVYIVPSVLT